VAALANPGELINRAVDGLRARRDRELMRCAKALFLEEDGTVKLEGQRLLADLQKSARLFGSAFTRDRNGQIDDKQLLRMEGRREIVLRLINLLELGPREVAQFVEVDNGN
jgi:hypothetical protein